MVICERDGQCGEVTGEGHECKGLICLQLAYTIKYVIYITLVSDGKMLCISLKMIGYRFLAIC